MILYIQSSITVPPNTTTLYPSSYLINISLKYIVPIFSDTFNTHIPHGSQCPYIHLAWKSTMKNIQKFIQNEEGVMAIEIISAVCITIVISTVLLIAIFQPHF